MVPWVHETTLTTKYEAATCYNRSRAAGLSKGTLRELFCLLGRTAERKVNAIVIYVHNVDKIAVIITFKKSPEKS
jgi:hypothetical protein